MSIQMSKLCAYEVCSYRFFDISSKYLKKQKKKYFLKITCFLKMSQIVDSTKRKENDDIIA